MTRQASPTPSLHQAFKALFTSARPQRIPKGTMIYYQGEVPRTATYVQTGCVKVYNLSSAGEEQLVSFHTADEFLPTPWLFDYAPASIYFYEAFTACELIPVSKQGFLDLLVTDPVAVQAALQYYTKNYVGSLMRITALEQSKASAKLLYTFYFLARRYGQPLPSKKVKISLQLTHQQLANLVGLTRETTATEIKRLQQQKIVDYKAQTYIVDVERLLKSIGEDSFEQITSV